MRALRFLAVAAIVSTSVAAPVFAQSTTSPEPPSTGDSSPLFPVAPVATPVTPPTRDEQKTAEGATPSGGLVFEYDKGFVMRSRDRAYVLRVGGYAQVLARFFPADKNQALVDQVVARTLRPTIEGTVYRYFDLRLQPDFGLGKAIIQDAYADVHFVPWLRVRIGKMKSPFGLERLLPETGLSFVERGLPTQLVPNRDLGLQVHGSVLDGVIDYALGGFNGVPDGGSGDGDSSDGKDVVGRVFIRPLRPLRIKLLGDIGVGMAASYGSRKGTFENPDLPALKTAGAATFFSYKVGTALEKTTIANGSNWRLAPQAAAYIGPVGVIGEYVRTHQALSLDKAKGAETLSAWQIAGNGVIGGAASAEGAQPKHGVGDGGWGAIEIVARYGQLDASQQAFREGLTNSPKSAHRVQAFAVGAGYVLNRALKTQVHFERSVFAGGAAKGDRPTENAILWLVQGIL